MLLSPQGCFTTISGDRDRADANGDTCVYTAELR
jgi:hypothetical protein